MKLKGLAAVIKSVTDLQEVVNDKIDDLDQDGPKWEEKDSFLNDVYMDLDEAIDALKRVEELQLEDYL